MRDSANELRVRVPVHRDSYMGFESLQSSNGEQMIMFGLSSSNAGADGPTFNFRRHQCLRLTTLVQAAVSLSAFS